MLITNTSSIAYLQISTLYFKKIFSKNETRMPQKALININSLIQLQERMNIKSVFQIAYAKLN